MKEGKKEKEGDREERRKRGRNEQRKEGRKEEKNEGKQAHEKKRRRVLGGEEKGRNEGMKEANSS